MNTQLYSLFIIVLFLGFLQSCDLGGTKCPEDGFIADKDTTITCGPCKKAALSRFDTLLVEDGKCNIHKLQCRKILETIKDKEIIRIGMEPDAPPTYFTEDGKETGFDYEMLRLLLPPISTALGVRMEMADVEAKGFAYDTLPHLLLQPKPTIEIIAGGYVKDDGLKNVEWTHPYLSFGYALITKYKDKDKYKDLESLKGAKLGVYKDGQAKDWAESHIKGLSKVVEAVDNPDTEESDWMKMLINGEVDAIMYDYPFAVNELKDYDGELEITNKRLNESGDMREYCFGIPCNNTKWLKKLNAAIDSFKTTSTYADLVSKFIPNPDADGTKKTLPIPAGKNTYTVKKGETLSIIALRQLQDMQRWREIFELNKGNLASPDIIYEGTVLIMP